VSQFRNVTSDDLHVGYGTARRTVAPDQILTVVDEADESYACQPTIWKLVEVAAAPATAKPPAELSPAEK
jgi:hypothetical protein